MSARILLVDDSEPTIKLLKTVLSLHGYAVVGTVNDGSKVLSAYKQLKPDMVVMDLAMPKKHGIDAIAEIMGFDPGAKILVLTALYSKEKRDAAMKAGGFALIEKPFDIPNLIKTLQSMETAGR
jgi:two-component system chemotaxis response regulator CheY